MNKELEALQELRDLVEYLTRVDFVPTELRNEVKELLIKHYEKSNGYFSQIEEALKRNEPVRLLVLDNNYDMVEAKSAEDYNYDEWYYATGYCPICGGQNPSGNSFCGKCGNKLDNDWSDEQ